MTGTERRRVIEDARIAKQIEELHNRIFDGLPQELRKEVRDEISKVTKLLISVLVALMLALTGIIVEGRFSATQASAENMRNYKAIVDIGKDLELHVKGVK